MIFGCWATEKVEFLMFFPDLWGKMIETCEILVFMRNLDVSTRFSTFFHVFFVNQSVN